MGVADHEKLVGLLTPELYQECEVELGSSANVSVIFQPYVLGLDLAQSWAMTSAAAVRLDRNEEGTHTVDSLSCWPGIPGLDKRKSTDGGLADYRAMHQAGELILQEDRRTVDVGDFLDVVFERWGPPEKVVADRFKASQLEDELERYGYHVDNDNLVFRGMGWQDGGEDVGRFQKLITDRAITFNRNRMMRSSFAVARVMSDPAGNQKIAKHNERKMRGRDDAAVATVLAVAELDRMLDEAETPGDDVPELVYTPEWDW